MEQIVCTLEEIQLNMNKTDITYIFLDISKTFDRIWQNGMI